MSCGGAMWPSCHTVLNPSRSSYRRNWTATGKRDRAASAAGAAALESALRVIRRRAPAQGSEARHTNVTRRYVPPPSRANTKALARPRCRRRAKRAPSGPGGPTRPSRSARAPRARQGPGRWPRHAARRRGRPSRRRGASRGRRRGRGRGCQRWAWISLVNADEPFCRSPPTPWPFRPLSSAP